MVTKHQPRPSCDDVDLLGCVLWINKKHEGQSVTEYAVDARAAHHPCIAVSGINKANGLLKICIVTSLSERPVEIARSSLRDRSHYLPICPSPINAVAAPYQLQLRDGNLLRKNSFVNTERYYEVPMVFIEKYDRHKTWTAFRLDDTSIVRLMIVLNLPVVKYGASPSRNIRSVPTETQSGLPLPLVTPPRESQPLLPLYSRAESRMYGSVQQSEQHRRGAPMESFPLQRDRLNRTADSRTTQGFSWEDVFSTCEKLARGVVKALPFFLRLLLAMALVYLGYRGVLWIVHTAGAFISLVNGHILALGRWCSSTMEAVVTWSTHTGMSIARVWQAIVKIVRDSIRSVRRWGPA